MKRNIGLLSVFILSSVALVISMKLFYNLGIYVDEYNTSPDVVAGSDFWFYMNWLRLFILFLIVIISGVKLFQKSK